MKSVKLILLVITLFSNLSCNKPFYCHCSAKEELIGEMKSKNKNKANSECDSYENTESGDCYITRNQLD